jgi:hypothetical protein
MYPPSRIDRPGFYNKVKTCVTAATVTGGVQKLSVSTTAKGITSFPSAPQGRFFVVGITNPALKSTTSGLVAPNHDFPRN